MRTRINRLNASWGASLTVRFASRRAQEDAERRMAAAQVEWEAAARPDSWAEWKAAHGRA